MDYIETVVKKVFVPVFHRRGSTEEGDEHNTLEHAEAEIQNLAKRAFHESDYSFDYADIKIRYIPEDIWDDEDNI
jgi:hypothetical protein